MGHARRALPDIAAEIERLKTRNLAEHDRLSLLHEIGVYQEELLSQNDELKRAQATLEETRDQFIELYDSAPCGYLTLDSSGVIRQCNLTAAAFFGRARDALRSVPLLGFIHGESRALYVKFLRQLRSDPPTAATVELTMRVADGRRDAHLFCRPRRTNEHEHFASIIDITERKELERERARTAREHAALASRLLTAIDEERQRIARNLHDDVGQQLTAIRMMFGSAIHGLGPKAGPQLQSVQQLVEDLDRRLHLVATELRPPALDVGLVTAVEQYVGRWSATLGIPAVVHIRGLADMHISPDTGLHLYRIIQEALNNIAKHAAARQVSVRLERKGGAVLVVVKDDGRGFDLEQKRGETTLLGLVGMRERAQMIGGQLRIQTAPTKGTSITVSVPTRAV
jgi:PAS domain S-box-containing protein